MIIDRRKPKSPRKPPILLRTKDQVLFKIPHRVVRAQSAERNLLRSKIVSGPVVGERVAVGASVVAGDGATADSTTGGAGFSGVGGVPSGTSFNTPGSSLCLVDLTSGGICGISIFSGICGITRTPYFLSRPRAQTLKLLTFSLTRAR